MADTDQVVDPTVDDEIEEDIPEPVNDQRLRGNRVTCSWKGQLERSFSWKVLCWKEVSN